MSVRLFRGDAPIDAWSPGNRGVAYGDGLFETMRVDRGAVHWWNAHWARLQRGSERLRMRLPDRSFVEAQVSALLQGHGDGVLKLVVVRCAGTRGYAADAAAEPEWMLALHYPPTPPDRGLALRWCTSRLALQPTLAGIKHCNRLEQVLARGEWNALDIDEGLMLDMDGHVIGATAANIFVLHGGRWSTPPVDRCGVAGVCREHLLPLLDARETRLSMTEVESADAVVLCNAVRGILAVARLGAREWSLHPAVAEAQRALAGTHPGFRIAENT